MSFLKINRGILFKFLTIWKISSSAKGKEKQAFWSGNLEVGWKEVSANEKQAFQGGSRQPGLPIVLSKQDSNRRPGLAAHTEVLHIWAARS